MPAQPQLVGCDFSSSPSRRKPIMLARGEWDAQNPQNPQSRAIRLLALESFETLPAFAAWLTQAGAWVGGFDLPFGLPRELVVAQGWPMQWQPCMRHYASLSRAEIRDRFADFCAHRPAGGKFAHRVTDGPAGSSPSMKWVNPPVAFMMHAGVPLLLDAGVHLPGLHAGDSGRVALEAYPGWIARQLVGRSSYKSDDRSRQTPERSAARQHLVEAIERPLAMLGGLRVRLTQPQRAQLVEDARGDNVDAVLCMLAAGWAHGRYLAGDALYGLPPGMDPLEGWIAGVQPAWSDTV